MIVPKSGCSGYFITEQEAAEVSAELEANWIHLPQGHLIHFINLRNMWRRSPERHVAIRRYARVFGIGRRQLNATFQAICDLEGVQPKLKTQRGMPVGKHLVKAESPPKACMQTYAEISQDMPVYDKESPASYKWLLEDPYGSPGTQGVAPVGPPLYESLDESIDHLRTKTPATSASASTRDMSWIRERLETAAHQYDSQQKNLDGPLSDFHTVPELLRRAASLQRTDDQVDAACNEAINHATAWYWGKGCASPHSAGKCIAAALKGTLPELEPGVNCSPELLLDLQQPQEAPAALDKGEQPLTPAVAASTALQGHTDATEVVIAPHTPTEPDRPFVPAVAQIAEQRKEQRETIETRTVMTDAELAARKEAMLRQFQPQAAHSPGRYGTPPEALTHTQAA